jgi:hypothetical protein
VKFKRRTISVTPYFAKLDTERPTYQKLLTQMDN